ncbi:hypothetical protein QZH41_003469 [Actinostola sp. cb2023]|nr:hypothetical protein QZH41_003469 [Actinostola sp. cb2023]
MAPYGYKGKDWVGYDDQKSLIYKIDNVVKKSKLRGVMFWSIALDDFSGQHCGQGKYPLMNAVKNYLTSGVQPTSPATQPPPPPGTTQAPPLPCTTAAPPPVITQTPPAPVTTQAPPLPVTTQTPPPPVTTQAPKPTTSHCTCPPVPVTTQAPQPTTPGGGNRVCKATGPWTGDAGVDDWCRVHCAIGYCPATHCVCS